MTAYDNETDGFKENPYFDRKEFACKCGCDYAVVDHRLLEMLTLLRSHLDAPIYITSGARCLKHNSHVGGAAPKLDANHQPVWGTGSQHLWGKAADIVVDGVSPKTVQDLIKSCMPDWGGIGCYREFTHIDIREKMARWNGTGVVNYLSDNDVL